ncbi:MAG TPA: serine hydrolase [Thermoanaerobaculia bacterium]|nr:serine hydrolase [Thermoanaerobaculia bacterium]
MIARSPMTSPPRRRLRLSHPLIQVALAVAALGSLAAPAPAQDGDRVYDYHQPTRQLVQRGMQALMLCNGLFVSNRTLDQVYTQELQYDWMPAVPPGQIVVDEARRGITVGLPGNGPVPAMRAVERPGLGCVVLAPDQDWDDVDSLPRLDLAPAAGDVASKPWPAGDLVADEPLPAEIDRAALEAAADWAFDRDTHGHPSQVTLSLLVVHDGRIVHEQYAPGVDATTRTRTWSTAKSIAVTLIGMLVDQGDLALDEPLGFEWLPRAPHAEADPRRAITLRDTLQMSSGLEAVDNSGGCEVTGSCLSYWGGTSSVEGALSRGLVREPGVHWDYENFDTLLAVYAMKRALVEGGDDATYLEYPRKALLDRIGMHSTVPGVDRFGDYVLSSQIYTNARDLARFGLLYLDRGVFEGERLISEEWVDFVRTPAPSTHGRGRFYGAQFWLPPDDRDDVPPDAYSTAGNRGQYVVIVPSHDLVIVRRGLDWLPGRHGFSQWDLTREVLKAFPNRPWGSKPPISASASAP